MSVPRSPMPPVKPCTKWPGATKWRVRNGRNKSTGTYAAPALADDCAQRSASPIYPTMSSSSVPRVSCTILSTKKIEMNAQTV